MSDGLTRDATYDERATWGECPVCSAKHGEWCDPYIGFQLGHRADGRKTECGDGAHLGRLQRAPKRVRLVAA